MSTHTALDRIVVTERGGRRLVSLIAGLAMAASLGAAAGPASAGAAEPIEVGSGAGVAIAVDGPGTAHLAWRQASPTVTRYCRVPEGTTEQGCPALQTFPPNVGTNALFDRALVAELGGTVAVLWRECCAPNEVNARVSANGGETFGPLVGLAATGPDNPVGTTGDPVTDGSSIGWTDGVAFQWAPLGGPAVTTRATLFGPVSFGGAAALLGARPLVVEESDQKLLRFRRTPAGNVNSAASWTAAKSIPTVGDGFKRPALGFDDADVFLAYTDASDGGANRPQVRRYLGASDSFGAPVLVADQSANEIDIALDATGRLHVVWANSGGVWWSTSGDRGASFSAPAQLANSLGGGVTQLRVGAGDVGGWAGARTVDGKVWAIPLVDTEPPEVTARAKRSQRAGRRVRVSASCDEECRLRATGAIRLRGAGKGKLKLRPASTSAAAGERKVLALRVAKKALRRLKRALRRGARAQATIVVRATDPAGNSSRSRVRVRIKP